MITKFNCGDIVKVQHKTEYVYGKIQLIAIPENNSPIYEIFLEKPIYNRDTLWYDESKITLQRRKKQGGGSDERLGQA
jgi:hypothetical protein